MNNQQKLKNIIDQFKEELELSPVLGAEIEFYLRGGDYILPLDNFLEQYKAHGIYEVLEESGDNQYEIKFSPTQDILALCTNIESIKKILADIAKANNLTLSFVGRLQDDLPASGLHIHVNFLDLQGQNIFAKISSKEPDILLYAINGLLITMIENMLIFAPKDADYRRYIVMETECQNAPTAVSWGGNNRTTAIRIPSVESGACRIEHRVASASANIYQVAQAILYGIYIGLQKQEIPMPKLYGNDGDIQYRNPPYSLTDLPTSLRLANKVAG